MKIKIVGEYIRAKRELIGLSQKALGLGFEPKVTTQFISNLERGVTPLPHMHIPTLAKLLNVKESEIASLLEKEYAFKLNQKLGYALPSEGDLQASIQSVIVSDSDYNFMNELYRAYKSADVQTKEAFSSACQSLLRLSPNE
jgi:transcriptional regulator with XRE-family HTH domain